MLEKDTLVTLINRDNGTVGYTIADYGANFHRQFEPNEKKEITVDEIRKLNYQPGGHNILQNCFIIDNDELRREILGEVEPEYFYSEAEVKELLLTGTLDQLLDCLQFAPDGVIELVKSLAVKLEINDLAKREAIFKQTGFNVNNAIAINKTSMETEAEETESKPVTRRAAPVTSTSEKSNIKRIVK